MLHLECITAVQNLKLCGTMLHTKMEGAFRGLAFRLRILQTVKFFCLRDPHFYKASRTASRAPSQKISSPYSPSHWHCSNKIHIQTHNQ